MSRSEIYRTFAERADGEFPCSWTRRSDPRFDVIHEELETMDAEGLLGCLLSFQNDVVTAQLNHRGIGEMQATLTQRPGPEP